MEQPERMVFWVGIGGTMRPGSQTWQQADSAGVDIVSPDHDAHDQDIAAAINAALKKDGGNMRTIAWQTIFVPKGTFGVDGTTVHISPDHDAYEKALATEVAAEIHRLIQSKPKSPTIEEIEQVLLRWGRFES